MPGLIDQNLFSLYQKMQTSILVLGSTWCDARQRNALINDRSILAADGR